MIRRAWPILLLLAACLPACGSAGTPDRPTQVLFDPSGDFWSLPFPSDLRRQPDGSYGLRAWPHASKNDLVKMWLGTADDRLKDGFGLNCGVFLKLSGPLDAATLPPTPESSLLPGASVYLLDIDPSSPERGRRFPLDVKFLASGDNFTPDNLLAARQVFGFIRRPKTIYALVLTDALKDAAGVPVGRAPLFDDAFEDRSSALQAARDSYRPLRAQLQLEGLDPARVIGAAVFTTMDPNADMFRLSHWAESQPLPRLTPWKAAESYPDYQVITGHYQVPVIQSGFRPYAREGEGHIVWGADQNPVIQDQQWVRLAITIPKRPMPTAGFPLTMYLHGSGGNYYQAIDRGPKSEDVPNDDGMAVPGTGPAAWLAKRGVATLAFDFPLHGDRNNPPDTSGLLLYNLFGNIDATIDGFRVAVTELVLLSRVATQLTLSSTLAASLDPGSAADRLIRFDPERLSGMGQSMGTTLGVTWAGIDPRVKAMVFSGAGGILVEIANTADAPIKVRNFLELALELSAEMKHISIHMPLLHAMQNLWDLVDPVARAPYVLTTPHDGFPPKHVLMTAGFLDGDFSPRAQAALAVPLGVPLIGPEVEPILPDTLRLAGRTALGFPQAANLAGKTAGVLQFAAPNELGHYVVFNQIGAQNTVACFLSSVGAPGGPVIKSVDAAAGDCP